MNNNLQRYNNFLSLYRSRGRELPPKERRVLIKKILVIEKLIVRKLMRQMLTGGLILNISHFPPRIQKLLQMMINRRMHIIYTMKVYQMRNERLKKERDEQVKEIAMSYFFRQPLERNFRSVFQIFSDTKNDNKVKKDINNNIINNK